jgi:O-antigen/teichoic acid export membrane protein
MPLRYSTLINLVGQFATVAISLATVPPFLRLIGESRYGVLVIFWLLLGYFSLFDLGLGQATAQRMATLKTVDASERSRLLWTSLAMNACMGVVAALVLGMAGYFILGRFVSMEPELRHESLRALPWMCIALPLSMAGSTLTGALTGREAFGAVTVTSTLGQLMGQGFPLFVAWRYSRSIDALVVGLLVARVVSVALLLIVCRATVPLQGKPNYDRATGRRLLGYGGWVTVSSIVSPLMTSLDRLLIGGIAGSQAVTYYSVPYGLAARLLMLPGSLSSALFPRFASSEREQRNSLIEISVRLLACAMTPIIVVGIFLVKPFLSLWISVDFSMKAASVAQVILLGIWANGLAQIPHSNLLAKGRPDLVARVHLIELPAYLAFLAGALHLWGVVGAAVAWTARVTVDAVVLYALSGHLKTSGSKLLIPLGLLVLAAGSVWAARVTVVAPWLAGPLLVILSLVWALQNFPLGLLRIRTSAPS